MVISYKEGNSINSLATSGSASPVVVITSLAHGNKNVEFIPYDMEFDDNFKPEWTTYDAFGRMDPIAIYKKTTRNATLSFNVVADNQQQALDNFNRLQDLINFLYPVYSQPYQSPSAVNQGTTIDPQTLIIKKSPLITINFMNLLNNSQYVIAVDNFKYKLKFDSSSTFRTKNTEGDYAVPGEFNISLTFKIIHTQDFKFNNNRLYNTSQSTKKPDQPAAEGAWWELLTSQ
jgi:hypothetical protein